MSDRKKIIIIGAGFAGQTAALYLGDNLGKNHDITMITRADKFVFIPSLVWVGVGRMDIDKVQWPLKPTLDKFNVNFFHGQVRDIYVDDQYVIAIDEKTSEEKRFDYDYVINATGPKLNFEGTKGLGPHVGKTQSICTPPHAIESRERYLVSIKKMESGEHQRFIIGAGHATATCQGAAFEYITNIHKDLVRRKIRDKASIKWLSNEPALGDFGIAGVTVAQGKKLRTSEEFIEAIFDDYNIDWAVGSAVTEVYGNTIISENMAGETVKDEFDFAMLIPQFTANRLNYFDKDGNDISDKLTNPAGFFLVDGVYGKPYEELVQNPHYWPATYRNPLYKNIYAAGISFAPPGPISRPTKTANGTVISPAPPRTGMVSGIIGRIVAKNIISEVKGSGKLHTERMTEMYAACIASMGDSIWDGSAAVIMVNPIVPNYKKFPTTGRDVFASNMEMGLAGAWMKKMIHLTFVHKFKGNFGWSFIPE